MGLLSLKTQGKIWREKKKKEEREREKEKERKVKLEWTHIYQVTNYK